MEKTEGIQCFECDTTADPGEVYCPKCGAYLRPSKSEEEAPAPQNEMERTPIAQFFDTLLSKLFKKPFLLTIMILFLFLFLTEMGVEGRTIDIIMEVLFYLVYYWDIYIILVTISFFFLDNEDAKWFLIYETCAVVYVMIVALANSGRFLMNFSLFYSIIQHIINSIVIMRLWKDSLIY